ncbi:MAG: hypothetical protein B1H09_02635, partial [Gemmatimonadaceae bacterium 4484_173]
MYSIKNGNIGKGAIHLFSALLGIGILVFIASRVGYTQFIQSVQQVNPLVLIPLILVYTVSWVFRGLRFRKLLHIMNVKSTLLRAMSIELIADLANHVIPAKLGDSAKVLYMHKTGMLNYTSGTFVAFMVRAVDLCAVLVLALFSTIFVSKLVVASYMSYVTAMLILVFLLVSTGLLFVFRPGMFQKLLIGPLRKHRFSVAELAGLIKKKPEQVVCVLALSVMVWLFDILTLFTLLVTFRVNLSLTETAFVMLLSTVTKILPLTPNGVGVYEGTMVVLMTGLGVSENISFTVAVIDHGFMNLFSILL